MPRPPIRAAAVSACAALLAMGAGCGGGDEPAATAPPAPTTPAGPAACDDRAPAGPPSPRTYGAPPPMRIDPGRTYTATLDTSCGEIVIRLDPRLAPKAVNNFVFLARQGFYDGLTFHRVVDGFVIWTGDPRGDGTGGPGYTFEDELPDDGYPRGSVAMANIGPNTNGSQFFIVTGRAPLPNAFTRFGRVVRGMDAAQRIEDLADPDADPGDPRAQVPVRPVYLFDVAIEEGPPATPRSRPPRPGARAG